VNKLSTVRSKAGLRMHLDRLLTRMELGADELSGVIERTYFSHSLERQVSGSGRSGITP